MASELEANVTTTIRIEAEERIDNVFVKLSALQAYPGITMAVTDFTGDNLKEPRPSVTAPRKEFPFPQLALNKGQVLEYKATTNVRANPSVMTALRCQQDILSTRLILLSESTSQGPPCGVRLLDQKGLEIPVQRTVRSTLMQANAQIIYSPFSIRKEARPPRREAAIPA